MRLSLRRSLARLLAGWLVCVAAAGCASRLVNAQGPATSPAPVGAEATGGALAKPHGEKRQRGISQASKPHGGHASESAANPLGDARERSELEPGEPW